MNITSFHSFHRQIPYKYTIFWASSTNLKSKCSQKVLIAKGNRVISLNYPRKSYFRRNISFLESIPRAWLAKMDQGSHVQNCQLHPGLCQLVLKSWHLREVTSSLDLPPRWPRAIRTVVLEYCIEVRSGFTLSEGFILFMEQDDAQSSASIS